MSCYPFYRLGIDIRKLTRVDQTCGHTNKKRRPTKPSKPVLRNQIIRKYEIITNKTAKDLQSDLLYAVSKVNGGVGILIDRNRVSNHGPKKIDRVSKHGSKLNLDRSIVDHYNKIQRKRNPNRRIHPNNRRNSTTFSHRGSHIAGMNHKNVHEAMLQNDPVLEDKLEREAKDKRKGHRVHKGMSGFSRKIKKKTLYKAEPDKPPGMARRSDIYNMIKPFETDRKSSNSTSVMITIVEHGGGGVHVDPYANNDFFKDKNEILYNNNMVS